MKELLVDFSYFAHRAQYSHKGLSFDDHATNILFGFFEALRNAAFDPKLFSNRLHLFLDSRQSHRREAFPTYKAGRQSSDDPEKVAMRQEYLTQSALLRDEILPSIGFPFYHQTGLESDDLMAQAAIQITKDNGQGVMLTADGDLWQAITHNVHWFDPGRDLYYEPASFWAAKELDPKDWTRVKSIAGCKTDNVPGVPGVGEKTAIDFILGSLKESSKKHQAIVAGLDIINRNLELVKVPHHRTKPVDLVDKFSWDPREFYRWCRRLGFESYRTFDGRREWDALFAGELHEVRYPVRMRK